MLILMAVAPNGGIAIKNLNSSKALAVDGRSYDPFGDTWHWTGRTPYLPSQQVANMILSEQDDQWKPPDAQQLAELLEPQQVVKLNQDPSLDTAHQVAAEANDPYLMAMAAAKVVMRNMKTGAMTATFPDDSKAYLDPMSRTVQPERQSTISQDEETSDPGNPTQDDERRSSTACQHPFFYESQTRCCICSEKVATCPCTPQDAMDHFMACHINDKCEVHGHPSILQMMIIGMPAPNKPCRNCGETPETSKMHSSTEPETPHQ